MFSLMADAMRLDIKDPLAKWLLVTLCDYVNDQGECWPSTFTLAKRTGMGRSTVAKKLNALIDDGYIERLPSAFNSSTYRVYVGDTGVSVVDTPVSEVGSNLSVTNHKPKRKTGVLMPDDWVASPELRAEIDAIPNIKEIDHDAEQIEFREYWQASGRKYISWDRKYKWFMSNYRVKERGFINSGGAASARSGRSQQGVSQSQRMREYLAS